MLATTSPRIEDLVERSFDELDTLVRKKIAEMRGAQTELGRALAAIETKGRRDGFTRLGVTSLSIYMESCALSPSEGFAIRNAAEACERSPEIAKAVEQTKLSVPKAALLNDMLKKPELQRPDEDLVAAAQTLTTNELRRELNERKAQARMPERPVPRTFFFSSAGVDALVRTRELVSNTKRRRVSESEAAEAALREFVDRNDPEQKALRAIARRERREAKGSQGRNGSRDGGPSRGGAARGGAASVNGKPSPNGRSSASAESSVSGKSSVSEGSSVRRESSLKRRAPVRGGASRDGQSTAHNEPHDRYIPAEDRHRVIARFGDRCWVAGCDDRSRQTMAHDKPFRFGGSNRCWNLARYCLDHHRQFDGGQWRVVINGADALLIDRRGLVVGKLRGLPPRAPPTTHQRAPP